MTSDSAPAAPCLTASLVSRWSALALLLLLAACGTRPAPEPPAPAPSPSPAASAAPAAPVNEVRQEALAPLEEEMARRLERGESLADNEELFDRLYSLARQGPNRYPLRLWLMMFSPDLQKRVQEPHLKPSDRDRAALAYLTEVLDPAWSLRIASVARDDRQEVRAAHRGRENCPEPLLPAFEAAAAVWGKPDSVEPWTGVAHLLLGSHEEGRGRAFAQPALVVGREYLGDLKGRDLADVGSGCGPTLPSFREALGPKARLYSVELDAFALDVMKHLNKDLDVQAVQGSLDDVNLPENSVDWIVMTGVHLGSGLGEFYESQTLPWLESMKRALRPGGILVIDDGNQDLLEDGMEEKVARAGFTLLTLRQGQDHPRSPSEWIAVFRVKK